MARSSERQVLSALREMTPEEFEEIVAEIWEQQGWETECTKGSRDRGVDVRATKDDGFEQRRHLIQAKKYGETNPVTSGDIQKYSGLYQSDEQVDAVFLVTTGHLTEDARKVAEERDVRTIVNEELVEKITQASLENRILDGSGSSEDSVQSYETDSNSFDDADSGNSSPPEKVKKIVDHVASHEMNAFVPEEPFKRETSPTHCPNCSAESYGATLTDGDLTSGGKDWAELLICDECCHVYEISDDSHTHIGAFPVNHADTDIGLSVLSLGAVLTVGAFILSLGFAVGNHPDAANALMISTMLLAPVTIIADTWVTNGEILSWNSLKWWGLLLGSALPFIGIFPFLMYCQDIRMDAIRDQTI